ncbi:BDH1 [Branchiostoma lanceolatum]|uniref:BDH1 protein n=1 Tax=Branchiostoma lanceolatum TaxID=7740 RepID=A0A8J9Z145_BRALA|nr:BDH1 [Branchiostoma lanceolatum]
MLRPLHLFYCASLLGLTTISGLLLLLYHCAPVLYYLCTGILLGSVGYCVVLYLAPKRRVSGNGKAVFITGCDSGFGFRLAKRLDSLGFTVFAGCLLADSGGEGSKKLRAECSSRLSTVQIDVTNDRQVQAAVQQVKDRLSSEGLYALVNNAGVWQPGEIEWVSIAAYRRVMEVNTFGTVRVTKAFLPLIRRAKGRVVNISSVGGLHAGPMAGAYSMTKAAVEFFSDALRHEMHKWGVNVVIVEPASFATATGIVVEKVYNKFIEDLRNNMEEAVKEDYGMEYFDLKVKQLSAMIDNCHSKDPSPVVAAMVDAVNLTTPSHRYLVGSSFEDYVTWMWLSYFPTRLLVSTTILGLLLLLYHREPVLYYLCTGILLGSVGYCVVLYLAPKSRVSGNGKAVFITGCDSGFGFGLAKRLDSLGFTVFAGCLLADSGGEGSKKLRAECSSRLSTVQIDVTDDGQVQAAVQQVKDRLYALVNNAGVWQPGEIEWVSIAAYRRVMEVNTFGNVRVTKAFLPLIRRAKAGTTSVASGDSNPGPLCSGSNTLPLRYTTPPYFLRHDVWMSVYLCTIGRVVAVTSAVGLHATPAASAYCMTKAATEFFSDTLRHEMHKWGVKVVIVEPGNFAQSTDIILPAVFNKYTEDLRNGMEEVVKEDYGMEYFDFKMEQLRVEGDDEANDATAVIDAMVDAVTLTTPSHRYLVGSSFEDYVTWMWLGYLPTRWTDPIEQTEREGSPKPAMLQKTY